MDHRIFELKDKWYIAKDESDVGRACGWERAVQPSATEAFVPSVIQQFFPEYHGLAYYWCQFTPDVCRGENDRLILRSGGVDYKADVWLNGVFLGTRECPETPFEFDVTEALCDGENLLSVRVLNPCDHNIDGINLLNVPHRNKVIKKQAGSCLNHGGMWYGVTLESRPAAYIDDVFTVSDYKSGEVKVKATLCTTLSGKGQISVSVWDRAYAEGKVAQTTASLSLCEGTETFELSLTVPNHKPWSLDAPNLYTVEVTLSSAYGEHRVSHKMGFREFLVKDGFFYLNGKKIYLKSAHTGNAFPVGQMLPTYPDQMRRDLIYAKSCGFNMLRSIAGMFRPEQIDLADEIGLLMYEECFASWCLGNSQSSRWRDAESYAEVSAKNPTMPLGDEQTMLARWRENTEKMILRDRNHPSLVTWGLLNETMDNGVFREAVKFIGRARELDPTRLVILNSGRFDYDFSIGSAANPYVTEWENVWGHDGDADVLIRNDASGEQRNYYTGDNHSYMPVPMRGERPDVYRNMGKHSRPVFKSETGIGPQFDVIDEYRHFKQYGERLDLEDCSWLEYQSKALERDFDRLGLAKIFAFPERMLRESQRLSALDRRMLFDILRSNPRISGYSLTGLLDHGMCGEGLWTYWREWKPEVFDAVIDGWSPLRFCLFTSHNTYCGEPIEIEVVLANDGVLGSGSYRAEIAILGERGMVYSESVGFPLDGEAFAVPVLKKTLDLQLPRGNYKLVAELPDAAARGTEMAFSVRDKADNRTDGVRISTVGLGANTCGFLRENGAEVTEWNGDACDLLMVGDADADRVNRVLDFAEQGGTVLFLSRECWLDEQGTALNAARRVVGDLAIRQCPRWLYHPECVFAEQEVFAGFEGGIARLRDLGQVFPSHGFLTETTPDYPVCPMFATGYYAVEMSYMMAHAVMGYRAGQGKVFFSTLELRHNIGFPVADRILSNLVNYLWRLK